MSKNDHGEKQTIRVACIAVSCSDDLCNKWILENDRQTDRQTDRQIDRG